MHKPDIMEKRWISEVYNTVLEDKTDCLSTSFEVTKTFSLLDNQALKLRELNQYNHEKLTSANTATILGRY